MCQIDNLRVFVLVYVPFGPHVRARHRAARVAIGADPDVEHVQNSKLCICINLPIDFVLGKELMLVLVGVHFIEKASGIAGDLLFAGYQQVLSVLPQIVQSN